MALRGDTLGAMLAAPLFLVLALACGRDDVAAEGESAEVAEEPAAVPADAGEAAEEEPPPPPVLLQHEEGPLRSRKNLFFGLVKSGRTIPFQDGRVLTGYRLRSERIYKVGDATFSKAEWYFARDRKLRVHRIWGEGMSSTDCDLAVAKIAESFGNPVSEGRGEKRWEKWPYELLWADTNRQGGAQAVTRCELQYRDLAWLRGVSDEDSVPPPDPE